MDLHATIDAALMDAVQMHVGEEASPDVCKAVLRDLYEILRDRFGVRIPRAMRRQITIEFFKDGVSLNLPPSLLYTIH